MILRGIILSWQGSYNMLGFVDYFLVQLKRILRLFPGILAMALVVALAVFAVFYGIFNSSAYKQQQMKYKLGLVGTADDDMLEMGVSLLENNDESRFMLELVQFDDEEEARNSLRQGKVSGYVLITDEFIDSMNALSNDISLEYFVSSGQRGINNVISEEIADIASNIIVSSEKGLLTLEETLTNAGYPAEYTEFLIGQLLLVYVSSMMSRSDIAEFLELGLSNGLNTGDYYIITLGLFFILMMSFASVSFFLGRNKASFQFISAKGLGPAQQILAEYLVYFLLNLAVVEIILGIIKLICSDKVLSKAGIDGEIIRNSYLIKSDINIIPAVIIFTALGFFLFNAIDGIISKLLTAFILYMGMAYLSGYFYPASFFPELLQKLGKIFPTGIAFSHVAGYSQPVGYLSSGGGLSREFCIYGILIYTEVFLILSILIRRKQVKQ